MKKLLTWFTGMLLLVTQTLYAQVPPDLNFPTYRQDADATFSLLNPAYIPTGILYDRIFPVAGLQSFNENRIDTTFYSHFLSAAGELSHAAYQSLPTPSPEKLSYYNMKASQGETVELGVLNFSYNQIDPEADSNIVYYPQNYLAGSRYSFLLDKTITMASVLANRAYTTIGVVTFNWSADNFFRNTNKTISYLAIDFGDGNGVRNLFSNNTISISYPEKGIKYIDISIYYTDFTSSRNYCKLFVDGYNFSASNQRKNPPRLTDIPIRTFQSDILFQGYDETTATAGTGDVGIYYKSSNGGVPVSGARLTKPVIVIDGFDPQNTRSIEEIYNEKFQYDNDTKNVGDEITDAGNDLVILDFPLYQIGTSANGVPIFRDGGSDYIERNAMVLVRLIQDINQTLASNFSTEQITIVGPSMGGLISRYALAYMEQHNIPHNCKLWVSFDAPHLGANIPIGDQMFLAFAATTLEDDGAREQLSQQLNNPAARQMLIVHNLGFSGSNHNIEQQGAPGFRDRFKGVMNTIGYPQQVRKVAIANGSINGTLTSTPGNTVLDFQYTFDKNKFFLGKSGLLARVKFAENYGSTSTILNYWRRTGLFQSSEHWTRATFDNVCSIDAAPGGTYNAQKQIADGLPLHQVQSGQHLTLQVNILFPLHNFIPTISALAVNSGSNDFCQSIYNRNLVCTNETPFASYYAPLDKNMEHVSFDDDLVAWFKGELNGIPQPVTGNHGSSFPIQLVSGSEPLCPSATYEVSNLPTGASVTWSTSAGRIALPNPIVGNRTTVTKRGNGNFNLSATIENVACAGEPFTVVRSGILAGPIPTFIEGPYDPINNTQMGVACTNKLYEFRVGSYDPTATYTWTLFPPPGSTENIYLFGGPNPLISFSEADCYTLRLTKTTSCGSANTDRIICAQVCFDEGFSMLATPNPATDQINVSLYNETDDVKALSKQEDVHIDIYDFYTSQKKKHWVFKNDQKQFALSVADLASGKYVLQVRKGKYRQSKHIIIN